MVKEEVDDIYKYEVGILGGVSEEFKLVILEDDWKLYIYLVVLGGGVLVLVFLCNKVLMFVCIFIMVVLIFFVVRMLVRRKFFKSF